MSSKQPRKASHPKETNSRNKRHPTTLRSAFLSLVAVLIYQATRRVKSLRGRTIVLTGAATGLGRALAFELAKEGSTLVLWDINVEQLEKTAAEVRAQVPGARVSSYGVNLANRDQVYELAERVKKEHEPIWGVINNAGIIAGSSLLETPDVKIELTMAVNALAHFWTCKAFLPGMIERNDGHICAISSAAGFFPGAKLTSYSASKFAARGFLESLRLELGAMGASGVKTTLVAPAHIQTDLFAGYSLGPAGPMSPEYVASCIVGGIKSDAPILFVPRAIALGNFWQGILPTSVFDLFMLPTNS